MAAPSAAAEQRGGGGHERAWGGGGGMLDVAKGGRWVGMAISGKEDSGERGAGHGAVKRRGGGDRWGRRLVE